MIRNSAALAFDLGAGSGRAILGELIVHTDGTKRLQVTEVHRFANEPVATGGHLYWDILTILREMKKSIRIACATGVVPDSYGIDTWGVDFGLVDARGELLGNPYHYRDNQTQGLVTELATMIGEEKLYQEGGLQFMPFNTLYQLYAMTKTGSPKLAAAETLLLTPDLLNYFLTGVRSCEFTMATTTQLLNPATRRWNAPLMKQLGIPVSLFPDPVQPGTAIGCLSDEVCQELGVPPIRSIAVASHDTESAIAVIGGGEDKTAYLVCGTWSLLGTTLPEALLSPEARSLQFSNEGGIGGMYQLLKNIMGLWLLQRCKRKWETQGDTASYEALVGLASEAEPFRSFVDPDDLRFMNPQDMEEEIAAFCLGTGQKPPGSKGEVVRCILESLALRYRKVLGQVERLTGESYSTLQMVGGGIQNELLCQFTANAIGRPVWAGPVEASAIGNLLVQFVSAGSIQSFEEGSAIIRRSFPSRKYEPLEKEKWDAAYERFEAISASI
ncbi:rhamnulokinase family protein [Paenibacillus sp. GCM10027626]|uniref:rhamnulokinase n=1 Tax=Paenibacillus sp. GCM10027626 TaxID=3273411 RepID=UPI003624F645